MGFGFRVWSSSPDLSVPILRITIVGGSIMAPSYPFKVYRGVRLGFRDDGVGSHKQLKFMFISAGACADFGSIKSHMLSEFHCPPKR